MANDLVKDWEKLKLTEDEVAVIGGESLETDKEGSNIQLKLTLVGFNELDDEDTLGWSDIVRLKINVDIRKPLRRRFKLSTGSASSKWINIKNERLADFCFFCGMLDHTDRDCHAKEVARSEEEELVFQYDPWLGATLRKRARINPTDSEKERRWKETLSACSSVKRKGFNDPGVIKLGPPGAARKLLFNSSKQSEGGSTERDMAQVARKAKLVAEKIGDSSIMVLRLKSVETLN
uniref:Zinc knuckle CX2CX4HX4C domain-containing protein n=1 Tax=Chenopodium quinoa TaxID=63459 RepID=A0A803N142_CHEQI